MFNESTSSANTAHSTVSSIPPRQPKISLRIALMISLWLGTLVEGFLQLTNSIIINYGVRIIVIDNSRTEESECFVLRSI